MNNLFLSNEHKERYNELISRVRRADCYNETVFYIISSCDLYYIADKIYNFKTDSIKSESLDEPCLTGTTRRLLLLAFELFTDNKWDDSSISDIFAYLDDYFEVGINALRIRFRKM